MKAKITIVMTGKTKEATDTILDFKKLIETGEFQKATEDGLRITATFEYIKR